MRLPILFVTLLGCAGQAPDNARPEVDASDEVPAPVGQVVSGRTLDYFGNVTLSASTVTTDGIDPQKTVDSVGDGSWMLVDVPTGSKIFMSVAHTAYRPTRNIATTVGDDPVTQDVFVMSNQDVTNQYTVLGRTPTGGRAFVVTELQLANGSPLEGIPLQNITLVDAADQPVPGVVGPVFFGSAGVLDPNLMVATAFGTPLRSRVAFLDVPPGNFTLKVLDPIQQIVPSTFTTFADGATLAINKPAQAGGNALDPGFAADIHPRLQRAALGGVGCANCHTAGGPGAILILDAPAAEVLASLLPAAPGGRIDTDPALSKLLTMPLYERTPPQNHPNATFLDINDADYKLILRWITNGTKP